MITGITRPKITVFIFAASAVVWTALPFASEPRLADALAFFIRTMITGDWEAHPLKTAKGWATDQPSSGTMIRTDAMR
jgi:hypothetical protein